MRIALYIRVSTDKEEQKSSIKHQREYLQSLYPNDEIQVYSDEGVTGTSISKRKGFIKLMEDCGLEKKYVAKKKFVFVANEYKDSKFDMIVTKSITRFARNTDIAYIWKELEQKGVSIFFQDVNRNTSNSEDSFMLKFFLVMSEDESRNISERTKFGFKASAKANKIINTELYGYSFNREENSLSIIEEEAQVVREMFKLCIEGNGYRVIESILKEKNIVNRKGNPFSRNTIKNMLHNKKYCGYNMRNMWKSKGLFTENHTNVRTKREEWIVQKNDRIEPIISEEEFNDAQEEIGKRLLHSNKGKNISKRDTRGKIVCGKCGSSYLICHSSKIGSSINSYPYYICGNKKKNGKSSCDNSNMKLKVIDEYIENLGKHYYDNINIRNTLKIKQLENEIKGLEKVSDDSIKASIEGKRKEIRGYQERLEMVLNSFLDNNSSKAVEEVIAKKIEDIENKINALEGEVEEEEKVLSNRNIEINKIKAQIKQLENEKTVEKKELSREEVINKIDRIKILNKEILIEWGV
ncbi:MAG: recombinase family protein [Clostridium sp.]|nr:recombinase family protein [Clostridium sp.]